MNPTNCKSLSINQLALTTLVALAAVAPALAQRYWIEDLPPLVPSGNWEVSYGCGINDAGVVVGDSWNGVDYGWTTTRWVNGVPEDLGNLPGWRYGIGFDVSNDGSKIVGGARLYSNADVPFIWDSNLAPEQRLAELPAPPGFAFCGAMQINDAHIIVGRAENAAPLNLAACRWNYEGTQWTLSLLAPLPGNTGAEAYDINNNNPAVIAGWSQFPVLSPRACRWDYNDQAGQWVPTELETLGGAGSVACGINDSNQYVGSSDTPAGEIRAYFHDGTHCINVGVPPGYETFYSVAMHVNNRGTVIGHGYKIHPDKWQNFPDPDKLAFVWRRGVMTVLNDALVGGAGWNVTQVWDINERGQIAGIGLYKGQWRACRLTPAYGDLNCDGLIDFADIDPFVLALSDPAGYQAAFPNCDLLDGDCNGDGSVDFADIDPFVALLSG